MDCHCQKNQTNAKSIEALKKKPNAIGTGLFLVPAPENGVLEYRTVAVANLDYSECVKRGHTTVAFSWIAKSVLSFEEIQRKKHLCRGFCRFAGGGCPPGCICNPEGDFCR